MLTIHRNQQRARTRSSPVRFAVPAVRVQRAQMYQRQSSSKLKVCFEVDTGACEPVISRETYEEKLSHVQLRKVFQTVSGQTIRPIGELLVEVRNRYGNFVWLNIFVLEPEKNKVLTPLLGRSSLDITMPE